MPRLSGMTLAICTRNRPDDLERCIAAIARQSQEIPLEVMIVDDGELSGATLHRLERLLQASRSEGGIAFAYNRKSRPGLLHSRMTAVEKSAHEVILFLDDDAELTPGYLDRLAAWYERHPQAAGVGGIDRNLQSNWRWDLFTRFFLYDSREPGKLSPSSYGGSMTRWSAMGRPFRTEYMLGCNMSFRKRALAGLSPAEWLQGYSVGEDLYLSDLALRSGELWIDPALQVDHRHSPASRDRESQVAYTEIVNHHYLLKLKQAGIARHAAHLWTSFGLLARAGVRKRWRHKAASYWKAIRFVLADDWRRLTGESVSDPGNG